MVAYNNPRGDYRPRDGYERDGGRDRYAGRQGGRPQAITVKEPTPCNVTTNLFRYAGNDLTLHQYAVTFEPEIMQKNIFQKFLYITELNKFTEVYAFDGFGILVSPRKFSDVTLKAPLKNGELICKIEYKNTYYSKDGSKENSGLVQCVEIISRYHQKMSYLVDKKKMFDVHSPSINFCSGLEVIPGLTSTIKFVQSSMYLNLDTVFGVFYKPMALIDFLVSIADEKSQRGRGPRMDPLRDDLGSNFYTDFEKVIKNIKVTTIHRPKNSTFKVSGLYNKKASDVEFEVEGKKWTVAEYFAQTYKPLRYPHLPLIVIKKRDLLIYLPMEVLAIGPAQKYIRKLDDNMTSTMIRIAARKPYERFDVIQSKANELVAFKNKTLTQFGMAFDNKMLNCKGVMLPPPDIAFNNNRKVHVSNGSWNLIGVSALKGVEINEWKIFTFRSSDTIRDDTLESFTNIGSKYGVNFRTKPQYQVVRNMNEFYNAKKAIFNLVVLPDKMAQRYEEVKRIAETYCKVYTQCLVASNVPKLSNPSFASNLLLKINAKLGGMNWGIDKKLLNDKTTILIGIDVNHPGIADLESPSVVSVVGTMDYQFINYKTIIEQQERRQEIVLSLKDSIKSLLKSHYAATKNKPARIMVFRDGVGDAMFETVYSCEMQAVQDACADLEASYKPEINFIIAQKRHSIRFMSEGNNLVPGTVVDELKTPGVFDFFLVSHHALQGTARPIRYIVVRNDSNFSKMDMYEITYNLCHLYARATKSVSVVPPIYYAHLGAERGKCYLEKNNDGVTVMRACDKDIAKTLYYV